MTKDRWQKLMAALGVGLSEDCYQDICAAYAEKHRHYHTGEHIDAMLRHFDSVAHLAEHPAELELVIWFNDAIYKPFSKTNELDSAQWAKEFLSSQNYPAEGQDRVFKLIMATQHNGTVENTDEQLMVDIDLTILGAPPEIYETFEKNVRKEYKWVPWFIYRKKRKEVLSSFLKESSIYHTKYFIDKFEDTARLNINKAITNL